MKSMTMMPPRSRSRSCLTTSLAASMLVFSAVSSRFLPQTLALVGRGDLARDADAVDGRHENDVLAGQADVRGDAGALAADAVLGDLDQDVLALLEQVADLGALAAAALAAPARALGLVVAAPQLEHLLEVGDHVLDVEEGVLAEADVDEGALHAGQYSDHLALVDVADDVAAGALEEQLRRLAVLHDGYARLVGARVDDDLLRHISRYLSPKWEAASGLRVAETVALLPLQSGRGQGRKPPPPPPRAAPGCRPQG